MASGYAKLDQRAVQDLIQQMLSKANLRENKDFRLELLKLATMPTNMSMFLKMSKNRILIIILPIFSVL